MADTGGLPQSVDVLRRRWRLALAVFLPVVFGAFVYVEGLPPLFDGETVVAFAPREGYGPDVVRVVLPRYVSFSTARATLEQVAPTINEEGATLVAAVDAQISTDTGNLTITARLDDPARAARAANAVAAAVVMFSATDRLLEGTIVSPALPPASPASPPRRLLEAAALVAAAALAVVAAVIAENIRPRTRKVQDVSDLTDLKLAGVLPPAGSLRRRPTEAMADPRVATAVRAMRTNLERDLTLVKATVFTSASPGDGKTTVCVVLAASLARLDAKVLIIDADHRRPAVGRLLEVPAVPGLVELLRDQASIDECITLSPSGLWVLPTTIDAELGDILALRFGDLLRTVRDRFDFVFVDAAPLLGTDTSVLLNHADGVLLVVSAGTLASDFLEAEAVLRALGVRVLAVVANRFSVPRRREYY